MNKLLKKLMIIPLTLSLVACGKTNKAESGAEEITSKTEQQEVIEKINSITYGDLNNTSFDYGATISGLSGLINLGIKGDIKVDDLGTASNKIELVGNYAKTMLFSAELYDDKIAVTTGELAILGQTLIQKSGPNVSSSGLENLSTSTVLEKEIIKLDAESISKLSKKVENNVTWYFIYANQEKVGGIINKLFSGVMSVTSEPVLGIAINNNDSIEGLSLGFDATLESFAVSFYLEANKK